MAFPVGPVLCLYACYLDPIECKLSMLRGWRSYGDFRSAVLPVLFNLLSAVPRKQENELLEGYLAHILQIHDEYLKHLKKRLGREATEIAREYPRTKGAEPSAGLIRSCNRVIRIIDGEHEKDVWDQLRDRGMSLVNIPEESRKVLVQTNEVAYRTFMQLEAFFGACEGRVKVYHSPFQAMYQFMAYFSHLSKGYILHLQNRQTESKDDFGSAVRHLRRLTLDMRKSILITIFKHARRDIPKEMVRAVLRARSTDLRLSFQDPQKLRVYAAEVKSALANEWF